MVAVAVIKSPSRMLQRLGLETHAHHATADADRLALMDVASPAEYRAHLTRIYGFEAAVETALGSVLRTPIVRDRAKTYWLRRDLQTLGMASDDVDYLPQCPLRLTSVTHALGWLFVLERHTLVSGLIRRELARRFGSELRDATSYLGACRDAPGARFNSLCDAIDEHAGQQPDYPGLIVAAAAEAFRCQRQWYGNARTERETRIDGARRTAERSSPSP